MSTPGVDVTMTLRADSVLTGDLSCTRVVAPTQAVLTKQLDGHRLRFSVLEFDPTATATTFYGVTKS